MLVKDLCFASLSLKTYANFSNSLVKTKTYFALTRAEKTKSGFCSGAIKGRKKHFREKAHHCCVFKKSFGIIFLLSLKKGKQAEGNQFDFGESENWLQHPQKK